MSEKLAIPFENYRDIVVLNNGDRMNRDSAKKAGYRITDEPVEASDAGLVSAWRAAIIASPEVKSRPSAAAELLCTQSHTTMTVDAARAFLRGLPPEQEPSEELAPVNTTADPKAARFAEIENSMQAFNHSRGYAAKGRTATPSLNSVEPTKMKRLAEIRLGALSHRMRQGDSAAASEHKRLTYAMSVHNQTGVPLATVFTQMGIDTSKMLESIGKGA